MKDDGLADEVGALLTKGGLLRTSQIVSALNARIRDRVLTPREVNRILYGDPTKFRRDDRFRWTLVSTPQQRSSAPKLADSKAPAMSSRRPMRTIKTTLDLYPWQLRALRAWASNDRRGIVQAV